MLRSALVWSLHTLHNDETLKASMQHTICCNGHIRDQNEIGSWQTDRFSVTLVNSAGNEFKHQMQEPFIPFRHRKEIVLQHHDVWVLHYPNDLQLSVLEAFVLENLLYRYLQKKNTHINDNTFPLQHTRC